MALTVTDRGTGTHNTGATTLVPGGRTGTIATGSMGVLCMALDNAGSLGSVLIAPDSWTDAKNNVWTLRQNALYDNGAASAGIEMAFYTAPITVDLLTTDAGTMTWKTGVSPVAKVWTWYEVVPGASATPIYSTGGTIAGATAANAQVTTASVGVGDAVIAGYFSENTAVVTQDTDTTNGSWAAQQTATVGTTTAGVRIATQPKVQTTGASTQSYDVTVASQDRIAGYILIHESPLVTVAAGLASITVASSAPTESEGNLPSVASLTLTSQAPAIAEAITAGAGSLTVSASNPAALGGQFPAAGLASVTISANAPTPSEGAGAGNAAVAMTSQQAAASEGIPAGSGASSLTASPAVPSGGSAAGAGMLTLQAGAAQSSSGVGALGASTTIVAGEPSSAIRVNAEAASFSAAAYDPDVLAGGVPVSVNAEAALIIATAYDPSILTAGTVAVTRRNGGANFDAARVMGPARRHPIPPPPLLIHPPEVHALAGVATVSVGAYSPSVFLIHEQEDAFLLGLE